MIVLLDGIKKVGKVVKCEECEAVVYCENSDWERVMYYWHDEQHFNECIDCPCCGCRIYRWERKQ